MSFGGRLLYLCKHWYDGIVFAILMYRTETSSVMVVLSKGTSEVRGLDRRVVETNLKLLRRGARTTMGHVEVAMLWS